MESEAQLSHINHSAAGQVHSSDLPTYTSAISIASFIYGIPVAVSGILGNTFTIVAVITMPQLRTTQNMFIVSLSVSDLLYDMVAIPIFLSAYTANRWMHEAQFCIGFALLILVPIGASLSTISCMAFSRYFKILHPPVYDKIFGKRGRVAFSVISCWLAPIILLFRRV